MTSCWLISRWLAEPMPGSFAPALIHRQMIELLRQRGVKPILATGADFDPRFHQAVVHEVSVEHREGEVMEELRKGYMLGKRLLRASMVKVAKA